MNHLKLPPTAKNSFLFSFEGLEASGKSTQIKLLKKHLEQKHRFNVFEFREPGGTQFGENLRQAILTQKGPLHPLSEAFLFLSSRAQLWHEELLPKLNAENTIVLVDRFMDSSFVYQGMARKLGMETVMKLHGQEPVCFTPHLTFYLKISVQTSLTRQQSRGQSKDYFEKENINFYENLFKGHEKLCQFFPNRVHEVNGEESEVLIQQSILTTIENYLTSKKA